MSEPDSGSDLASVRTRAVKVDGGWSITGRKVWTTFAHLNHFAIVLARTGEGGASRHGGLSQFIVDLQSAGREGAPDSSTWPAGQSSTRSSSTPPSLPTSASSAIPATAGSR